MVKLATRVVQATESATISVSRRAAELAASGVDVVDLGAGEPDFSSPADAVQSAVAALRAGDTRYTSVDGTADLRTALVDEYARLGGPWTGEGDVIVTVGAKSALLATLLAVVDPEDEVLIPSPCWVSLPAQVRLASGRPRTIAQDADSGFAFDVDGLIEQITDRTKVVILNSPCNPTGAVLSNADLYRLTELCAARDILVLLDATYEHFDYRTSAPTEAEGERHAASVAASFPDHLVYVSSFSKAYAMTGWRIGYALGPARLIAGVRSVQSHATTHPTTFAMRGAVAALRESREEVRELVRTCRLHRDYLVTALREIPGVDCQLPDGAFYALADVRRLFDAEVPDSAHLAQRLLDEQALVVVPGSAFEAEGFVRLSFAAREERLREGVKRFRDFVSSRRHPQPMASSQ